LWLRFKFIIALKAHLFLFSFLPNTGTFILPWLLVVCGGLCFHSQSRMRIKSLTTIHPWKDAPSESVGVWWMNYHIINITILLLLISDAMVWNLKVGSVFGFLHPETAVSVFKKEFF